jgi:phosphoenolpyruvate carboxylase
MLPHRVRRARESDTGLAGEPGLWAHHLRQLRESGISELLIAAQLNEIRVEPVLTAHPTEAKRLAELEQHRALYGSMIRRENQMWTPQEQAAIRDEAKVTLERLWRTGEVHRTKPVVAEERRNVIYYLQEVFPGEPEADAVLSCFRVIKEFRDRCGVRGIGSLIARLCPTEYPRDRPKIP